ncbi:MAG: sulfatase-like hydrolase/transferase [Acidobacteriota bacterium]|nr:sulfatase-like hydrolase/transferase [Acidobacteriota bacterium]
MRSELKYLALVLCLLWSAPSLYGQSDSPNIVFIMLDDLGWADVGVNGGTNPTPEMDTLASQGFNFTNYHTMGARCSPTRASVLTGLDPITFGIDVGVPDDAPRSIPSTIPTLPQVLALPNIDYATWHIGKWHLGILEPHHGPCGMGFERSRRLIRDDRTDPEVEFECAVTLTFQDSHATQVLTDEAIDFFEDHLINVDPRPFFLNLWYWAPHTPLDPPPVITASVPPEDRHKYLPEYCPPGIEDPQGDTEERQNFDALVCFVDYQIGRLVDKLEELDLMSDTLFIVTSDNGGTHQSWHGPNGPFRGSKPETFEGGIRAPLIVRWDGNLAANQEDDSLLYSFDWFPTFFDLGGGDPLSLPVDGRSFASLLKGGTYSPQSIPRFWESRFSKSEFQSTSNVLNWGAMRQDQWKLVVEPTVGGDHHTYLFNIDLDPYEQSDLSLAEPLITSWLYQEYMLWRKEQSRIPLTPTASSTNAGVTVTTDPNSGEDIYQFDGTDGLLHLTYDERKNFHDTHFSFVVDVKPDQTNVKQMLASSQGAWKLVLRPDGTVALNITGENNGPNTILVSGQPIASGQWHRVAFTVRNWWRGGSAASTVRLFVGNQPIVETNLIVPAETSPRPVSLGAKQFTYEFPFAGEMKNFSLHTMDLYPQQIR